MLSAVRSTTTDSPISGRSSATTFCIIAHCSDVRAGRRVADDRPCAMGRLDRAVLAGAPTSPDLALRRAASNARSGVVTDSGKHRLLHCESRRFIAAMRTAAHRLFATFLAEFRPNCGPANRRSAASIAAGSALREACGARLARRAGASALHAKMPHRHRLLLSCGRSTEYGLNPAEQAQGFRAIVQRCLRRRRNAEREEGDEEDLMRPRGARAPLLAATAAAWRSSRSPGR